MNHVGFVAGLAAGFWFVTSNHAFAIALLYADVDGRFADRLIGLDTP